MDEESTKTVNLYDIKSNDNISIISDITDSNCKKEMFELTEEFNDITRLKYLLTMEYEEFKRIMNLRHKYDNNYKNENERKQTFKNIQKFCTDTINNKLINKIIWIKNKCGRFYSNNSIQNLPREIKNFLTEEIMTDIDIKNCQPTILLNICKKYNIQCANLEYYCNNRNEILEESNLHKSIFTASINYNKRINKIKNEYFNDFDKEIKKIQKELLKIEDFKSIIDEINEKNKKELKQGEDINLEGKLMNKIYFYFECQIVLILKSLLEDKGYKIGIYSYDGLMIYGLHYDNNELLEEINKKINEEINFNYKITILFKKPEKIIKIPENWKDEKEHVEENILKNYCDNTKIDFLNKILRTQGENDYAKFFTYLYGYKFVFVRENIFYIFNEKKIWQIDNDGTTIRKMLSNDYYEEFILYQNYYKKIYEEYNLKDEEKEEIKIKINKIEIISSRLKKTTDKNNILKEIKDEIKDSDFDKDMNREKYVLPLENSKMFNMKTLEIYERTIKNKFNYECNANYINMTIEEENDIMKYFMDLFCDNERMVYCVLDIFKSIFSGLKLRYIFFFTGVGSNGKSLLFKLLVKIFQKAIDTISTDVIIERTNKSSITTEFEKLDKSRLGYITELKEVHKLNIDIIKKISGGDDIDSRGLFKSNTTIQPTTNLCVLTNELPKFNAEQAIIDRIIIIPFNNRFEVNINYEEEMMNKKDLIFSFIMKNGNIKDKFDLTEEMISCKNEYIENNTKDYLKDFIEEYYDIKEFIKKEKILRDEFRRSYDEYCIKKRIKVNNDTNTKFTRELLKKYNIDSKETHGKSYYIGLVKKTDIIEEEN